MRTSAHSPDRGGSGGWNLMLTFRERPQRRRLSGTRIVTAEHFNCGFIMASILAFGSLVRCTMQQIYVEKCIASEI